MRSLETTFIVDSQLTEEEIEAKITRYEQYLLAHGAELVTLDRWGLRRLAYDIKKRQQGFYVLVQYRAEGGIVKELEREFELDEGILRYLTIALESELVKEQAA